MVRRKTKFAALLLVELVSTVGCLFGQSSYTITSLGTLPGPLASSMSSARGINESGQIAGYSAAPLPAAYSTFLYSAGTMSNLGGLGGATQSFGYAINATGQVVGMAENGSFENHAVLYSGGSIADLGVLSGDLSSTAYGINASGQIVGWSSTGGAGTTGSPSRAFLYSNGMMSYLGALGGSQGQAHAINDAGQIAGYAETGSGAFHAFAYAGAGLVDLGTLGGTLSNAFGINSAGHVVGYSTTASGHADAFLYSAGNMTDLGTLGGGRSLAFGINGFDQIVGSSDIVPGTAHAFVYENGQLIDLNSLTNLLGSGFSVLTEADAINDRGQIVGFGTYQGATEAFLLTPIPEPSAWAVTIGLVALGFAAVGRSFSRRRGTSR